MFDFPECPIGTPLGHLEVNDTPAGKTYFLISTTGLRTQLHQLASDSTYKDVALLEGSEEKVPVTKTLYQRSTAKPARTRQVLPHASDAYVQGPIVSTARHFEQEPQVNIDACDQHEAAAILLQYLQKNPLTSKNVLHKRFHCSTERMLAILQNPDWVVMTKIGPMRVYSVKI
jgi:hypothetical protein